MTSPFKDEWLVRVLVTQKLLNEAAVESLRAGGHAFASSEIVRRGLLTPADLSRAVMKQYNVASADPAAAELGAMALSLIRRECLKLGCLLTLEQDALWHLSEGEISDSEALGLLRAPQAGSAPAVGPAAPPAAPPAGGSRILIVDDNPANRLLIRKTLETEGHALLEADSGRAALEMITGQTPDLLLLDILMPGMDGFAVLKSVRGQMGLLGLPILIVTALGEVESQTLALKVGADDYMTKPFSPNLLRARVHALLRRSEYRAGASPVAAKPAAKAAVLVLLALLGMAGAGICRAADDLTAPDRFASFDAAKKWFTPRRAEFARRAQKLLADRDDLSDRPSRSAFMSGGKPVQEGVRARLPAGLSWAALEAMTPDEVRERGFFPPGFLPLPHPNHPEGGMLFPEKEIAAIKKQDGRDLERFDLDFDIPDRFEPEFPPGMYLTTRTDLGDVAKGRLLTIDNYYEVMKDVLNPKQLDGLRLLLTPFPEQQFNATDERRSARPSLGVSCFDCHANGSTNGATHLAGDGRPQSYRHRVETPALRGVNVQRLFGSQRALKTVEDFTEFEQRGAYFDGDIALAAKKGVNPLERESQVLAMAEFMELLNFPPAPKLGVDGKLDPKKASEPELRGQALFFGKANCASCHAPPYYTDNSMHDLRVERFFKPRTIHGMTASADGPIKTFPLRGIKDTPPYLHDGRLLTLADSVRFFNVVLETKLTEDEESDVVEFLKAL